MLFYILNMQKLDLWTKEEDYVDNVTSQNGKDA